MAYIRDKTLLGTLTNWEYIIDSLPGECGISDIDGVIERNGYFLVLESKNSGERLPQGQKILLEQLSRLQKFTVIVVTMNRVNGYVDGYQQVKDGEFGRNNLTDTEEFGTLVSAWFLKATQRKPV